MYDNIFLISNNQILYKFDRNSMYVYKFVKIFIFLHKLWKLRIICIDTECLFRQICVMVWYEELACDIWHLYHNPNQFYSSFCVWINYANLVLICIIDISFVHDKALLDSQNNHFNCHKNLRFVYEFIQIFMILHKLCKLGHICIGTACLFG